MKPSSTGGGVATASHSFITSKPASAAKHLLPYSQPLQETGLIRSRHRLDGGTAGQFNLSDKLAGSSKTKADIWQSRLIRKPADEARHSLSYLQLRQLMVLFVSGQTTETSARGQSSGSRGPPPRTSWLLERRLVSDPLRCLLVALTKVIQRRIQIR
jgi:hypothetical protein